MIRLKKNKDFISLQEATKYCQYSQEYLSLRARQKKLKSVKLGRNWFTKKEWLEDYLKEIQKYNEKQKIRRQIKPPDNLPVEDLNHPFVLDQLVVQEETKEPIKFRLPKFYINFDSLAGNKIFNYLILAVILVLTAAWTFFVVNDIQKSEEISEIVASWHSPVQKVNMNLRQKAIEVNGVIGFILKKNFKDPEKFWSNFSNYAYDSLGRADGIFARKIKNLRLALQIVGDYSQVKKAREEFSFLIKNIFVTYQGLADISSSELLRNLLETFSEYGKWLSTSVKNQFTLFLGEPR
jgi:hypothetical protein